MQLKGSDTFFATRFRPTTANTNPDRQSGSSHNNRSYKLVKKRSCTQQSMVMNSNNNQYQSENIFRSTQLEDNSFNYEKDRPVGGVEMFLKQQNKKNRVASAQRITNRTNSLESRRKQNEPHNLHQPTKHIIQQEEVSSCETAKKQQTLKQHHRYRGQPLRPKTAIQQNHKSQQKQPKSIKSIQHNNWVVKQTQNYQNKMSVLNEVYYKKPLVQRYGDRYFQFMLRNRYEEDFQPPIYIHQIKSELQARNANNDKFISKIKKIHPNVKNFEKLVVKGKHFTNFACSDSDFNL